MSKTLQLGSRLRYPITIVKLLKSPGNAIRKQEPLMRYSFRWMKTVGDHVGGNTWEEEQTTIVDWDSPVEGDLQKWHVKEGEVIDRDRPCMVVKEACSHEIQFQGLCAICGKDMTEVNWATETRDTERAPINMVHDQTNLTVSETQAKRAEQELQRRLLEQRKLSLVVDLDQTIIHACIEPTVGEWQKDPANPNHESVKDVRSFQLNDDGPRGLASGCWYYIKMRPGLEEFLSKIADMYELHVYTMGTRAYALNIARIVDPEQKLFGNRVISRDENGNMTAKSLQRLFPVSTNMVVIIDDRADVWPRNRPNLIKVTPYDFFKGIGDINSSFLPKREDLLAPAAPTPPPSDGPATTTNGSVERGHKTTNGASRDFNSDKVSALDEFVTMSGGGDAAVTKRQIEEQEKTLEKQLKERPLLHLQEQLDKEDQAAEKAGESQNGTESPSPAPHQRHHLLLDDDHELSYLEQHLTRLHQLYYSEYDAHATSRQRDAGPSLASVPDVGGVLDKLKAQVLRGTKIVLSGIIPMGIDVPRSEIGLQVVSFGAELGLTITKDVTHLVISTVRSRTKKVQQAAKIPSIKIVNQDWLAQCLTQWRRVDETPYLMEVHPPSRPRPRHIASELASTETTDAEPVSDADDMEEIPAPIKSSQSRILRLKSPKPRSINAFGGTSDPGDNNDGDSDNDNDEDEGDDDEGLAPPELLEGEMSPVDGLKSFNWGAAEEELDEFLASGDDEDEDDEGKDDDEDEDVDVDLDMDVNADADTEPLPRKRKHADDDDGPGTESETNQSESPGGGGGGIAKKQRLAGSRGPSGLRTEYSTSNMDSSLPTPQVTGDEDNASLPKGGEGEAQDQANAEDDFEFDDADLEAEYMAELEADERAAAQASERDLDKG